MRVETFFKKVRKLEQKNYAVMREAEELMEALVNDPDLGNLDDDYIQGMGDVCMDLTNVDNALSFMEEPEEEEEEV